MSLPNLDIIDVILIMIIIQTFLLTLITVFQFYSRGKERERDKLDIEIIKTLSSVQRKLYVITKELDFLNDTVTDNIDQSKYYTEEDLRE